MAAKYTGGLGHTSFGGGSNITWDAEALHQAAEYFAVPADLIRAAMEHWQNRVSAIGPAWGTGSTAVQLASQYNPAVADFHSLLVQLGESFTSLGISVSHASQAVVNTEDANQS